jgi:hypothetical protein
VGTSVFPIAGDAGLSIDEVTTVTSRSSRSIDGVITEAAGWNTSDVEPTASEPLETVGSYACVRTMLSPGTHDSHRTTHQLHPDQKVILMFDQELQHRLTQRVFRRSHLVFSVGDDPRLEDDSEVYARVHPCVRVRATDSNHAHDSLGAVIKLTSDFLAKTLNKSST